MANGKSLATKLTGKKKLTTFLLLISICLGYCIFEIGALAYCEGFNKKAITGSISHTLTWKSPPPEALLQKLLKQPIYCYNSEANSYNFQTSDNTWFINCSRASPTEIGLSGCLQANTIPPDPALLPLLAPSIYYLGYHMGDYVFKNNNWIIRFKKVHTPEVKRLSNVISSLLNPRQSWISRSSDEIKQLEKNCQLSPIQPSEEEISQLLNQPFYYLGKGSQSYIFESKDGNWVIKFFRLNRYRVKTLSHLPSSLNHSQQKRLIKKSNKLKELYNSCQIASTSLRYETALHYLHITPTDSIKTDILVYDKLGRPSCIDANTTPFMIQPKAQSLYSYFYELSENGNHEEIEQAVSSLNRLLISRSKKGIGDHDPEIHKNTGFVNGVPIFIDVGQFYLNDQIRHKKIYKNEIDKITRHLNLWLNEHTQNS